MYKLQLVTYKIFSIFRYQECKSKRHWPHLSQENKYQQRLGKVNHGNGGSTPDSYYRNQWGESSGATTRGQLDMCERNRRGSREITGKDGKAWLKNKRLDFIHWKMLSWNPFLHRLASKLKRKEKVKMESPCNLPWSEGNKVSSEQRCAH